MLWRILIFYVGAIFRDRHHFPVNDWQLGQPLMLTFAKIGITAAAGIIALSLRRRRSPAVTAECGRMLYARRKTVFAAAIAKNLSPRRAGVAGVALI